MIKPKGQTWNIGDIVAVGFLKGLRVEKIEAINDGLPDIYTLRSEKTGKRYEFVPHNGIHAIA